MSKDPHRRGRQRFPPARALGRRGGRHVLPSRSAAWDTASVPEWEWGIVTGRWPGVTRSVMVTRVWPI